MLWLSLSSIIFTLQLQFASHLYATNDFVLRSDIDFTAAMPQSPHTSLTKVMWWNLGCSSTRLLDKMSKKQRINFSPESSWQNLRAIIKSNFEPDVLILGEYCPADFNHSTYEILANNYSHIYRVIRSNPHFKKRNGLRVFSKHPIRVKDEFMLTDGSFATDYLKSICQQESINTSNKVWSRHLSLLEIEIAKTSQVFTLIPVHLANPWKKIARCLNPFYALKEIYHGANNVNYLQVLDLVDSISKNTPAIVIGDFNAPRRGGWFLNSNSYKNLQDNYGYSIINNNSPTYIDKAGNYPNSSIDHAFSLNIKTKYGEILPLAGSDHLPIMVAF